MNNQKPWPHPIQMARDFFLTNPSLCVPLSPLWFPFPLLRTADASAMKKILFAGLPILYLLHQDLFFWNDPRLVFGVLPAALAYQVGYTLLVCAWMTALTIVAWPDDSRADRAESAMTSEDA